MAVAIASRQVANVDSIESLFTLLSTFVVMAESVPRIAGQSEPLISRPKTDLWASQRDMASQ
jgi:hypothetical protein